MVGGAGLSENRCSRKAALRGWPGNGELKTVKECALRQQVEIVCLEDTAGAKALRQPVGARCARGAAGLWAPGRMRHIRRVDRTQREG